MYLVLYGRKVFDFECLHIFSYTFIWEIQIIMKIFMLCNVKVPLISEAEGTKPCDFGGWLDNISRFLSKDNDLTICYMNNTNTRIAIDNNLYVGFVESQAKETLFNVISEKEYDIFHQAISCILGMSFLAWLELCTIRLLLSWTFVRF